MANVKGLRVVVAEDDEINLFIIMKTLKDNGHIGVEFTDGNLAWAYLCAHPIEVDMVILDKMMIQMHGLEVVANMKNHPILKTIPIIVQSGDVFPDKIKEAVDVGIDYYITKPFKDEELVDIINELALKYKIGSNG